MTFCDMAIIPVLFEFKTPPFQTPPLPGPQAFAVPASRIGEGMIAEPM